MIRWIVMLLLFATTGEARVRPGIEVLLADSLHLIRGLQLGLVTNQTGVDGSGHSTIDLLAAHPEVNLVKLFAPEHGLDGSRPAGEIILNEIHAETGLQVTSLYHGERKVDPLLLEHLDAVLFDIQDVGVRPYTYVSTMAEVMRAAGSAGVKVIILDRPNPMGGQRVSGLVLDPAWSSFIGLFPTTYVHGMTVAELARLYHGEFGVNCDLDWIPMSGWQREMLFRDTGLPWIPTSPHVPTWETAWALAAVGAIGELGSISEGVGTTTPFFLVGGPGVDMQRLKALAPGFLPANLTWMPWTWIPRYGAFAGQSCSGIRLLPGNNQEVDPARLQLLLLGLFHELNGDFLFQVPAARQEMFDKAMGGDTARLLLQSGGDIPSLIQIMEQDAARFEALRRPYLIY